MASGGYEVNVFDGVTGGTLTQVMTSQAFNYAAPALLQFGFSAGVGSGTEYHEVRLDKAAQAADVAITKTLTTPDTRTVGDMVSYTITVSNKNLGATTLAALITDPAQAPLINDSVPALTDKQWTCVASGSGTTCPAASGAGDLANLGGYTLGQGGTLTFTFQGKASASMCATPITNTAMVDFAATSAYTDVTPADNTATSAAYSVDCTIAPPEGNSHPVPMLSAWALALLGSVVAGLGALGLRRREF
ncbi:MAG TPA: hypothetical protein VGC24_10205 [Burkholderiaceae bacterium]